MRNRFALYLLAPCALLAQTDRILLITAPVTLDASAPASFACKTSQSTMLHLDIVDDQRVVVFKSQDWGAEPNRPVSKRLALGGKPRLRRDYTAQLSVRYTASAPSVAFALAQGIGPNVLGPSVGKTGFVPDPARLPGGRFEVFLPAPASVLARIWTGERQAGPPVFSLRQADLPEGPNPIGWNLQNARGRVVPTGRYLGRLDCSPVEQGLHPFLFIVSFTVETPAPR
jgi:hypothetical protein